MKVNSIERDIHLLESYAGMTHKMNDNQGRPKLDQAIEHILSDYKRVLKENEQKNKMIDLMAEDIYDSQIECNRYFRDKEEVKASFLLECLKSEE